MIDARTIRSRAPVRVDFAGGWTDVAAFAATGDGVVVNASISLYVDVELGLGRRRTIFLCAEDREEHLTLTAASEIAYDGTLDLHKAALNMMPVPGGVELISRTHVPRGSGLGASGALDVALLAALARAREEPCDPVELAEMGFRLETSELDLLGGRQDQYAAALGGCHEFHFSAGGVDVRPVALTDEQADELGRVLVVAFTGESHFSSRTHERVWAAFARGQPDVTAALRAMRDVAVAAAGALRQGDWRRLGTCVDANWQEQRRLDATIATARTDRIETAMREAGAWGVKATGAGAGGCLLAVAPPDAAPRVRAAAEASGAVVLRCAVERQGVRVTEEMDVVPPRA